MPYGRAKSPANEAGKPSMCVPFHHDKPKNTSAASSLAAAAAAELPSIPRLSFSRHTAGPVLYNRTGGPVRSVLPGTGNRLRKPMGAAPEELRGSCRGREGSWEASGERGEPNPRRRSRIAEEGLHETPVVWRRFLFLWEVLEEIWLLAG